MFLLELKKKLRINVQIFLWAFKTKFYPKILKRYFIFFFFCYRHFEFIINILTTLLQYYNDSITNIIIII